eukprot:CFRG8457T1
MEEHQADQVQRKKQLHKITSSRVNEEHRQVEKSTQNEGLGSRTRPGVSIRNGTEPILSPTRSFTSIKNCQSNKHSATRLQIEVDKLSLQDIGGKKGYHTEVNDTKRKLTKIGTKAKIGWGDYKEFRYIIFGGSALAFNTGFVNVVFLLSLFKTSIAYITGGIAYSAISVAQGNWIIFIELAGIWFSFFLGGLLSGILVRKEQFKIGHAYGRVLLCVSILLFGSAIGIEKQAKLVAWYTAATAMGMQNAMATTFTGAVIRTTHFTGLTTDLSVLLAHVLTRRARKNDYWRFMLYIPQLGSFFSGNVVGYFCYQWIQEYTLFIPAALTGVLGLIYIMNLARIFKKDFMFMLTRDTEGVEDGTASWMVNTKNIFQGAVATVKDGVQYGFNEAKASVASLRYNVDNLVNYTIQRSQHSRHRRCSSSSSVNNLQSMFLRDTQEQKTKDNIDEYSNANVCCSEITRKRRGQHRRSSSLTTYRTRLNIDDFVLSTGSNDVLVAALEQTTRERTSKDNSVGAGADVCMRENIGSNEHHRAYTRGRSRSVGINSNDSSSGDKTAGNSKQSNRLSGHEGECAGEALIEKSKRKYGRRNRFKVTAVSNRSLADMAASIENVRNLCDPGVGLDGSGSEVKSETESGTRESHLNEDIVKNVDPTLSTSSVLSQSKDKLYRTYYGPIDTRIRSGSISESNRGRRIVPHITVTIPPNTPTGSGEVWGDGNA